MSAVEREPGNRRMDDAARGIAEDFLPLARSMARRFAAAVGLPNQLDEFEAWAIEGLCESAASFDPARGVHFAAYARPRIEGRMRDGRRWLLALDNKDQWSMAVEFGRPPERATEPAGPTRDELLEEAEAFIRTLPVQLKPLARLLLIDGLSQAQAARDLGCTRGYVYRLHRQITDRIGQFAA